jgi:hypothetical protein
MLCSLSTRLRSDDIVAINALEKELGTPLLAFSCEADLKPAEVTGDQLAKIKTLEGKLGLSLVAVTG